MVKDEFSRRVIEDEIVQRLKVKGVQSYTQLAADVIKNGDTLALNKLLNDGQYTHIILMRLSNVEKEVFIILPALYHRYVWRLWRVLLVMAAVFIQHPVTTPPTNIIQWKQPFIR